MNTQRPDCAENGESGHPAVDTRTGENSGYKFFYHGTSTSPWLRSGATRIRHDAGGTLNLDFGQGFYAFQASGLREFDDAAIWARRNSSPFSSPVVLLVAIRIEAYYALRMKRAAETMPRFAHVVRRFRDGITPDGYAGYDVINGRVAGVGDGGSIHFHPTVHSRQYAFKTWTAAAPLRVIGVIPVRE